jgi:hypothetical protein
MTIDRRAAMCTRTTTSEMLSSARTVSTGNSRIADTDRDRRRNDASQTVMVVALLDSIVAEFAWAATHARSAIDAI